MPSTPRPRFRRRLALAGVGLLALTASSSAVTPQSDPASRASEGAPVDAPLYLHVLTEGGANPTAGLSLHLPMTAVAVLGEQWATGIRADADLEIDGQRLSVQDLKALWAGLVASPEGAPLSFTQDGERVELYHRGGYVFVARAEGGTAEGVEARLPVPVVDALLSPAGDVLDVVGAVHALADHGDGEIVVAGDGGERVRIWVDTSPR